MVVDSVEYDFHLLPSGVLNKKAVSFIGMRQSLCFIILPLPFTLIRHQYMIGGKHSRQPYQLCHVAKEVILFFFSNVHKIY